MSGRTSSQPSEERASRRWAWLAILKLALAIVVCGFVTRSLHAAWSELTLQGASWTAIRWPWVLMSGAAYLGGMLPMGIYWYWVLRAVGETPTLARTLQAFYVSQLGKYVPGKVTVVLVRMSMLQGEHVDQRRVTLSVFVETLTMMAVGAACGAIFLFAMFCREPTRYIPMLGVSLALLAIAGIPTAPPLLRLVLNRLTKARAGNQPAGSLLALNGRLLAFGWLLNLPGWTLFGISYWAALRSLPLATVQDISFGMLPRVTASIGLSVVAGFVSMLPGGAFVREWVLQELMSPVVGAAAAIMSAIWVRLIWIAAEGSIAAILSAVRWRGSLLTQPPNVPQTSNDRTTPTCAPQ